VASEDYWIAVKITNIMIKLLAHFRFQPRDTERETFRSQSQI
jgi:hypothetical protein